MPSGSLNHEAAQSLIERALQAERQSEALLLIGAAVRLEPGIPAEAIQNQWIEKWLKANQERKVETS